MEWTLAFLAGAALVASWIWFGRVQERQRAHLEAVERERDRARTEAESRASDSGLLRERADLAEKRTDALRREVDFDVNATTLLPDALSRFAMGDRLTRARAIAESSREVLAVSATEVLLAGDGRLSPAAHSPGTTRPVIHAPIALPESFDELAAPVVAGALPPGLRVELAALGDDTLVIPLRASSRTFGLLVARDAGRSPLPEVARRKLATALGAAGGLAIGHAEASGRMLADNALLQKSSREAAWSARRSEERLVRTGQLARFGEFAASVAHDLKTPLGFIRGELDLLDEQRRAGGGTVPPAELERALGKMLDHCARMRNEIDKAMRFVRPGQSPLAEVDLEALLREVAEMLATRAGEGRVSLQLEISQKVAVRGNLDNLRHAVANLVVNAIDAMPEGGEVTLSLSREERMARIGVLDHGPGVPESIRPRLFQPFVSTKGENGTGLGLASCRRIVEEEHGGSIRLEESGRGALFVIRLPV